jgi:hypothetical protein
VTLESLTPGLVEVDVSGFFTTHHYFDTEAGLLGELTMPAFSSHAVFQSASGREFLLRRVHWLGNAHAISENGKVRGKADRCGVLDGDMVLQFDGQEYALQSAGLLSRGWYLCEHAGYQLLEIQPRGFLQQGVYLTLFSVMDVGLVAFVYYLVLIRWQEDAAVVAATAS